MSNFSRSQANLAYGLFGLCLLLFRPSGANAEAPPAKVESARISAEATHIDHAPTLDGTLDDPLWQRAEPNSNFRQREPHEGEQPTEKTEVRVLYTRHAVYFGIYCYDSEPSRIIATELRRDVIQDLDDHFEILIDSNHNRRDAYVFEVNPLGTQNDGLIVEEQGGTDRGDFDRGWDGVWTSEARITPDGWTATIEIPFTTLNFNHSSDVVWGLNLKRFIRRKNEEDLWSAYRRTFGITKVSEAGELRGIKDIGSGRLFIVKPYGLARYDKQSGQDPLFPLTGGVDFKYGLTSKLVLNLTANTDFADTDVDLEPFNLTPFKVFIPEKRQFFLENAGIFNFDMGDQDQLFFSRQIGIDPITGQQVPINGGAKLTGAFGRTELGIMFTQRITTPFHIYKSVFIPNGLYQFARHQLTYGSGQDRRFTYNFFERFGGYYGGTLNEFRVRANYRPTAKFSISASETWDRFRLPLPNGNFSVVLASLQGNYSFT